MVESMILPDYQKLTHLMRGLREIRGFHLSNDSFHLVQESFPPPMRKSWPQLRTYRRKDPGQRKSYRQNRSHKTDYFGTHASIRLLIKISRRPCNVRQLLHDFLAPSVSSSVSLIVFCILSEI